MVSTGAVVGIIIAIIVIFIVIAVLLWYFLFFKKKNSCTAAPATPAALTFVAAPQANGAIQVAWANVPTAVSYKVYQKEGSPPTITVFDKFETVNAPTASVSFSTLVSGQEYFYIMTATNSCGTSLPTNPIAATACTLPGNPTITNHTFSPNYSVTVPAAPSNTTAYNLSVSDTTGTPVVVASVIGATCSSYPCDIVATTLTPPVSGDKYDFSLQPTNGCGNGQVSTATFIAP
jgi:heme/copper-type cytochrome/quinol oxidase subunit 2